jgi:hypothetical protein
MSQESPTDTTLIMPYYPQPSSTVLNVLSGIIIPLHPFLYPGANTTGKEDQRLDGISQGQSI